MIYFLILVVGLGLGLIFKQRFINFFEKFLIRKKYPFKVKFNVQFIIHRHQSKTNEIVKTETIEVKIFAGDENEAADIVNEIIEKDVRVEIENIEMSYD